MSDFAGIAETAAKAAGTAADTLFGMMDRVAAHARLQREATTYLRLLYLEILSGLELFEAFDVEALCADARGPDFGEFLSLLKTEFCEGVLFVADSEREGKAFERLRKKGRIAGEGAELKGGYRYESVLQALSFVVVKLRLLRAVASSGLPLRDIRLSQRLANVRERMLLVKALLDEFEEVRDLAR